MPAKPVKDFIEHYSLDQLIAETVPPPLGEDEFTIASLSRRMGCTYETAQKHISDWERDGRAESVGKRFLRGGHIVDAWKVKG